jgi:hypothetical protein
VVTTTIDGTSRTFSCTVCAPLEELLQLAVERAPRGFTLEERETYLHE